MPGHLASTLFLFGYPTGGNSGRTWLGRAILYSARLPSVLSPSASSRAHHLLSWRLGRDESELWIGLSLRSEEKHQLHRPRNRRLRWTYCSCRLSWMLSRQILGFASDFNRSLEVQRSSVEKPRNLRVAAIHSWVRGNPAQSKITGTEREGHCRQSSP